MKFNVIGSSRDGYLKAPTLLQIVKDEIEFPTVSIVQRVFRPSTGACWSFLTEVPYRVNVYESSPLFNTILHTIDDMASDGLAIAIHVPNIRKPEYELVTLENESATWERKDWGYELKLEERKPKTKANPSRSTARNR